MNFLVGIILAFVGITQLRRFGAEYYVADIVGIAVVRDMAALITAIVLAGRSGAAYAAQLATMKVTQEVDALSTLGISPVEFLVVPRLVALTVDDALPRPVRGPDGRARRRRGRAPP